MAVSSVCIKRACVCACARDRRTDIFYYQGRDVKSWSSLNVYRIFCEMLSVDACIVFSRDVHKTSSHTRPSRDRDGQPSRPRRDRGVPKKRPEIASRSFKALTGEVCHLTTCFLRVRSVIFFPICPQAWCIVWMFTRPKVTVPETRDRDVISSRPRRDRDVPKNVSRPPRDRDVQDWDYPWYSLYWGDALWCNYLHERYACWAKSCCWCMARLSVCVCLYVCPCVCVSVCPSVCAKTEEKTADQELMWLGITKCYGESQKRLQLGDIWPWHLTLTFDLESWN